MAVRAFANEDQGRAGAAFCKQSGVNQAIIEHDIGLA
jgi:hypothetical protein